VTGSDEVDSIGVSGSGGHSGSGPPPRREARRPGPGGGAAPLVVLVAGTGTEVGKTWVGAALAAQLSARGRTVAARKPAQSFAPGDDTAGRTDAHVLAAATGEDPAVVCPPARWYPVPMAPPMAAAALGRPAFTIAELAGPLRGPVPVDVILVETAGGVRSPLADDGDTVALARLLRPHRTVLVADAGLGTINAVRLSVAALAGAGPGAPVVFLNRFDPASDLHAANARWLSGRDGLRCVTTVGELADNVTGAPAVPIQ
jgi:dethiobiotin synthetase